MSAVTIEKGNVLVSTLVRGREKALAYEVLEKNVDAGTVLVRPIGWQRYTATVDEVVCWGQYDPELGKRVPNIVKKATRIFGRPTCGLFCGPEEEKPIGWGGKFLLPGVSWPERNEMAFVYYSGPGYPVSILADEPPPEKKRGE